MPHSIRIIEVNELEPCNHKEEIESLNQKAKEVLASRDELFDLVVRCWNNFAYRIKGSDGSEMLSNGGLKILVDIENQLKKERN
jgi:hypothetical protein